MSSSEVQAYQSALDIDWDGEGVASVAGNDLVEKAELIGVPIGVHRMVFRGTGLGDYVSCEAVVIGTPRRGSMPDTLKVGDLVVFNDGSTGIRRECVKFLVATGKLTLPKGADPEDGAVYDALTVAAEGKSVEFNVLLKASRGLRRSDYVNSFGDSTTYYFG
jgi:hypothetical protein